MRSASTSMRRLEGRAPCRRARCPRAAWRRPAASSSRAACGPSSRRQLAISSSRHGVEAGQRQPAGLAALAVAGGAVLLDGGGVGGRVEGDGRRGGRRAAHGRGGRRRRRDLRRGGRRLGGAGPPERRGRGRLSRACTAANHVSVAAAMRPGIARARTWAFVHSWPRLRTTRPRRARYCSYSTRRIRAADVTSRDDQGRFQGLISHASRVSNAMPGSAARGVC